MPQPDWKREAELKYPLDFCLWLHNNFDVLAAELNENKSFISRLLGISAPAKET